MNKNKHIVVLTADHSTPVSLKSHSGDPVPIVIWGKEIFVDKVKKFDEFSVRSGGLLRIKHRDVVPLITNYMGRGKMFGT